MNVMAARAVLPVRQGCLCLSPPPDSYLALITRWLATPNAYLLCHVVHLLQEQHGMTRQDFFFALLRSGFCTLSLFSPCIFVSRDLLLLDESNRNGKLWLAEGIHHLLCVQLVAAPCHPVNSRAEKQGLRLCQQTQLWMLCRYYPNWLKSINLSSKIFSWQSLQNSGL